jgi:UDP-N-acetylmuramyl tripeptide synthase
MEGRLGNLKFNLCLLTNLKSDHLDYHNNIKNYHSSKIDMIKKCSGLNSKILIQDYKLMSKLKSITKNIYDQKNFIKNHNLKIEIKDNASVNIKINEYKFQIKTISDFVLKNTISILHIYHSLLGKFPTIMNKTIHPKGRSDIVFNKNNKIIIIDYAHTVDAFKNLLTGLNQKFNDIIVVYGCGGDRDSTKRSDIAKTVSDYSNLQIITDDNPRSENPKKIRDFLSKESKNAISIANREDAIKRGIKILSKRNGLLIIAGKGHEDKQIYKNKVINISDHSIVKKYAKNL